MYIKVNNQLAYKHWNTMLKRSKSKRLAYQDITICDEWKIYNNFEKWFEENYYTVPNERMEVDKDILIKGNKIYSPSTCIFVPQTINGLFEMKSHKTVSHHFPNKVQSPTNEFLPTGVTWRKDRHKYRASLNLGSQIVKNLGHYDTIEEAFIVYKQAKEQRIKDVAEEYKPYIPNKLYEAMINWEINFYD